MFVDNNESANRKVLFFPFPHCMAFISFSDQIVVTRTSRTMLNKNGESVHISTAFKLRQLSPFRDLIIMVSIFT